MVKDYKEIMEHALILWATIALIPGIDFIDFPIILLFSKLLNLSYAQFAIIYYILAFFTIIVLAPKKLKKIWEKIRRLF